MCWIDKLLLVFQGIQLSEDVDWQVGNYKLMSKIHWRSMYYANLPYTFTYISKGSKSRFYVYQPNLHRILSSSSLTQISQKFDLDSITDRLGIIKTTLNIYSIFKGDGITSRERRYYLHQLLIHCIYQYKGMVKLR